MEDGTSPLMLRRRLRTELRTARLKRELTQDQVARAMEWSLSKMNRIENAKTGISIRRRDLLSSQNAPEFSFVLGESVIHRLVGSPAVTSGQLMHLVNAAKLSNVTIQIVPFTVGLHPGMNGSFEVVQSEDTPDENIVFLDGPRGDFISDDPNETEDYLRAFRRITEKSLGPSESLGRLHQAADEMT